MDGPAEEWYLWLTKTKRVATWFDFIHALRNRFGPSKYRDLRGELAKLTQQTTVEAYQLQFETLSNQIFGIDEVFLQSCFESGLKPSIRREVRLHRPSSLDQAVELAKLIEDKFNDGTSKPPTPAIPPKAPPLLPTPPRPPFPIKKLTPAEMMERREKGLCYNCDEKFTKNHICKGKLFALLIDTDDNSTEPQTPLELDSECSATPENPLNTPPPEISYHALDGQLTPHTFRLQGFIQHHPIQVLIDSGSTHNFIRQTLVNMLQLPVQTISPFPVLVGNGATLNCAFKCPDINLTLQHHKFLIDKFVITLQAADLVLGIQWLQQLGDITTNYNSLSMQFTYNQQPVLLQGQTHISLDCIQFSQYIKLANQGSIHSCYALTAIPPTTTPSTPYPPALQHLLNQYDTLFAEPTQLPSSRPEDHQIILQPNTSPINVRPYRYPHYQKTTIE